MIPRQQIVRLVQVIVCLALLPSAACAAAQPVYGPPSEKLSLDLTQVYIWNEPLNIIILKYVSVSAPVLVTPVQILFALFVWLHFGHRRVSRHNALESENRNAVYLCIRDNPGIRLNALSRLLEMNIGTLHYHVDILCRMGMVVSEQISGNTRYFVGADTCPGLERKMAGYLNERSKRRIFSILLQHPGSTRKEIASRLFMAGTSVTWHMKPLLRDGIVRGEKDGRCICYFLCPDAEKCMQTREPGKAVTAGGWVSGT